MKCEHSHSITVLYLIFVSLVHSSPQTPIWIDPNPFDANVFKNDNWKCKNDQECQNEYYCAGDSGCLSAAKCKSDGFCECPPGRYGWRCQYATCDDYNFCQNDGDCMIVDNKHECACSHDSTGRRCEHLICNEHTCNGNCTADGKCKCPSSLTVKSTTNEGFEKCDPKCNVYNPCQNGAQCQEIENIYSCKCPDNFHGPHCDRPDCHPDWCINGLCMDHECVCFPGYSGKKCEIASCKDYQGCFDKGICNDSGNVLRCMCDEKKYAGTYCEHECTTPCPANSKCGFDNKCFCDIGYIGKNCEIPTGGDIGYISALSVTNFFVAVLSCLILIFIYLRYLRHLKYSVTEAFVMTDSDRQRMINNAN